MQLKIYAISQNNANKHIQIYEVLFSLFKTIQIEQKNAFAIKDIVKKVDSGTSERDEIKLNINIKRIN